MNCMDNFRQTPLFYASREGRVQFISEFIELGANPMHKDKVNQTALFYAAREGQLEVCKLLIERGCDPNFQDLYK